MVDVLESGLVEMGWNSWMALLDLKILWGWSCFIFIIVVVALAREIFRAFVLMGRAKLEDHELWRSVSIVEEMSHTY